MKGRHGPAGTTFHGRVAMRISVSNWATTPEDGDRAVDAILDVLRGVDEGVDEGIDQGSGAP